MNKAYIREPDQASECFPRCDTQGETVGSEIMRETSGEAADI